VNLPLAALLAAAVRLWTPLALAAMGGVVSERSGVVNIGLEGMMLGGAFAGVAAAHASGNSALAGAAAGVLTGALIGLLHAFITQALRVSHILSGVGLNLLVLGATTFAFRTLGDAAVQTTAQIPGEVMAGATVLLVLLVWVTLYRTPVGLRLRACGENPQAARTAGISVGRIRYGAVAASGALAGLGGVALSLTSLGTFTENMTAGRGYIALAAVIFGRWNPLLVAGAALFFAFGDALQLTLQTRGLTGGIPPDFLNLLPYVFTLAALAFFSGRTATPAALGETE
jgi:simple sugar transport system permease protein